MPNARSSSLLARIAGPWAALVLTSLALSGSARAQLEPPPSDAEGRCETPRQAFYTVLYWLQPERLDRTRAAACLDRTGLTDPERQAPPLAAAFKTLLDEADVWVRWEDVPDEPDYRDADGEHRFALYPDQIAGIEVQKIRGRWLVARSSQELVAKLAKRITDPPTGLRALMPDWLRGDVFGVEAWQLIGLVLLILIGILIRKVVIYLIVHYLRRLTKRIKIGWLDRVVAKADSPLGTLVVAGVIAVGSPVLQLPDGLGFIVLLAVRTLAAFSVVWLLYRLVDVVSDVLEARAAKTESKLDDQLVPLLRKSLKVFFVVIGAIFILQNLDVDVGSLLAGLGLGGLAFALAAKDTVANFFGSIMIFIDKPFQIGDWIVMSGIEGTVEEVGFRTSRIRTFYNSVVTVPNANVTNTAIDNMGARRYRRYKATLGLTYDTPPEKVQAFCEGVRAIVHALPQMRKDYYFVEFQGFGDSALEIMLYVFFDVPDWAGELRARTLLNLEIVRLAEALEVSFAFPTQTVHIARETPAPSGARPGGPRPLTKVIEAFGPGGELAQPGGFKLSDGYEPRRSAQKMRLEEERSDSDDDAR